ncbi:MAG: hypothetical protein DPW09_03455 [Anaerolineae bacterium]|nr:hypothetical protein [Anaerolineae bacterium]
MPYQNRVTPFGQIIAVPERGTMMGNRGILHDASGQLKQGWATKAWIICSLALRSGRQPLQMMAPGHYTPLFFLDEATALAAGHRPCAECRRPAYTRFKSLWLQANADLIPQPNPPIAAIDAILHRERLTERREKRVYQAPLADLPIGTFITLDAAAFLVWEKSLLCWSPAGYVERVTQPGHTLVSVLTPASVVKTLAAGYVPKVHPSVKQ